MIEIPGRVFHEWKIDIVLNQQTPLSPIRREWSFPRYRIYVATVPKPLTAIMAHVPLASSAPDLEGNQMCKIVV